MGQSLQRNDMEEDAYENNKFFNVDYTENLKKSSLENFEKVIADLQVGAGANHSSIFQALEKTGTHNVARFALGLEKEAFTSLFKDNLEAEGVITPSSETPEAGLPEPALSQDNAPASTPLTVTVSTLRRQYENGKVVSEVCGQTDVDITKTKFKYEG